MTARERQLGWMEAGVCQLWGSSGMAQTVLLAASPRAVLPHSLASGPGLSASIGHVLMPLMTLRVPWLIFKMY